MESALRGAASGETPLEASRETARLRRVCAGGKARMLGVYLREEQGRIGVALREGSCQHINKSALPPATPTAERGRAGGADEPRDILNLILSIIHYKRAPTEPLEKRIR